MSRLLALFLCATALLHAVPSGAEALLIIAADQHSAYERSAQLLARVDRLAKENPGLPLAVLLDGDTLEYGNIVARRTSGALDFALFTALAQRAPTIVNLGNHEPEFYDVAETVARLRATGVTVVSNLADHATGQPYAPASTKLKLGPLEATVVGLVTDRLNTFRAAVRPSLDLTDPVVWGHKHLPSLLADAPVSIVLSHAGVAADRDLLPLVPDGTLFAGAHDHLRFVHREGRTVYVHSGSWNEFLTLAWLKRDAAKHVSWEIEQVPLETSDPADSAFARLIGGVVEKNLTPEDTAVVGHSSRALGPTAAARFVATALRDGAHVDAAFIGNTTFGAGLPAGKVSRVAFDACVRFDGTIYITEVDGATLRALLRAANQGPDTPWNERRGEFSLAAGPAQIDDTRRYRITTTDWGAKNSDRYFAPFKLTWQEQPSLKLKALTLAALNPGK